VLLLCAGGAASAEDLTVCADRPGKATATCTVPAGHWQIETGLADWSLQKAGGERDTSLAIGETMIKLGLTDASNIEVDLTPWERATSRSGAAHDSASGFGDVNILLPFVKVPTANRSLGNGEWEGGFLLPIGYAIPSSPLSLAFTPEMDLLADGDGNGHHIAMTQVIGLGWQATSKLNLSAELWGQWDWDPAGTTRQYSADTALAYLVGNRVQLDAGANFGLNRNTPDVELYAGFAELF
jgi:hypothetical protein